MMALKNGVTLLHVEDDILDIREIVCSTDDNVNIVVDVSTRIHEAIAYVTLCVFVRM